MLKRPSPRRWQTGVSSALLLSLFAGAGYAAWAQQPAAVPAVRSETSAGDLMYGIHIRLDVVDEEHPFEVQTRAGEPFGFMTVAKQGHVWSGDFTLTPAGDRQVMLKGQLKDNETLVASPQLLFKLDRDASIEVNNDDARSLFKMHVVARVLSKEDMPKPAPADADRTTSVFKGDVRFETAADGTQHATANAIDITREASQKPFAALKPPSYPREAVDARIEGRVILLVDVAADGSVAGATVETSQPVGVFDAAVLKAVRGWTFSPAMREGTAVAGRVRVPVDFALNDAPMAGTHGAKLNRDDYGWFTEEAGKEVASTLNCDAALVEKQDVTGETRRRCGISRPTGAMYPAVAPQSGVQAEPVVSGLMADR